MADYTRWWQYIIILTIVGFIVFVIFQTYFVYVPIERINDQVFHTTDLLDEAAAAAIRIEAKIDGIFTILEPLILPLARTICAIVCDCPVPTPICPTATFDFCASIAPTGTTGITGVTGTAMAMAMAMVGRSITSNLPIGPTGPDAPTIQYYHRRT